MTIAETNFPIERQRQMLSIVQARKSVSANELANMLYASLPTIRRDLAVLERAGLLVRSHGGASVGDGAEGAEPLFLKKIRLQHSEKQRIAAEAANCVADREIVLIDSGTTALALAHRLADRVITIVTMDIKVAEAASVGKAEVLLLGGRVRNRLYSVVGSWTKAALNDIQADVFFLTADAVDEAGVTNANVDEAEIKAAAISRAERTILIADHTKIGRRSFVPVCPLSALDMLISDRGAEACAASFAGQIPEIRLV